jgi:hypothetical protein
VCNSPVVKKLCVHMCMGGEVEGGGGRGRGGGREGSREWRGRWSVTKKGSGERRERGP